MLNLLVMIRTGFHFVLIFWMWFFSILPQAQTGEQPDITTPLPGQALQGAVMVSGHTALKNFQSAEVSYSYASGGSWFLISQSREAVDDGKLAIWDTTTITDGDYKLRVQVFLSNGSLAEKVIGVRVRNYSPVETSTPEPTLGFVSARPTATITPTAYLQITPTDLPGNPAKVSRTDLETSLRLGAIIAVLFFAGLGLYLAYKKNRHLK
jgi:hypothetical protein